VTVKHYYSHDVGDVDDGNNTNNNNNNNKSSTLAMRLAEKT
jgi:hypothetical protein